MPIHRCPRSHGSGAFANSPGFDAAYRSTPSNNTTHSTDFSRRAFANHAITCGLSYLRCSGKFCQNSAS
jgi:hypothetical protein